MGNPIASTIFCVRNTDKVENGDLGRVPVALGQGRNVVNSILALENNVGKKTQTTVDTLKVASKNEALLKYFGKSVNYFGEHVNFLICASAGLKVMTAEDKKSAAIEQTSALTTMFAVEKQMKKHMDSIKDIKGIDRLAAKISEFSKSIGCKNGIPVALKGIFFVTGSVTAYNAGEKFGIIVANKTKQ